ncbi:LacI family transcriptional regulator [Prauserella marina]|uniref:LacI family transcriptional regulator n=1 Tax=Prauserella marina TaxID=530584 RepID=A0A1G6SKD4_9PSEU|nr:substrate-binding domain-containing protein [Prauserella marina]PWV82001.1 LacI family transcriptional regulator [Prauserella marina]SDD17144.1 LacI family transcriptional regulator [Prauserella marina]
MSAPSPAQAPWATRVAYRFGVVIGSGAGARSVDLSAAIERVAKSAGCAATFAATDSIAAERAAVRMLCARGVDGLLLTPARDDDTVVAEALRLGIPTVLVDHITEGVDVDKVATEYTESTAALTLRLVALGHHRIGFISGATGASSDERALGYRLGLGRAGIPWTSGLIACAGSTATGAETAARRVLGTAPAPTALIITDETVLDGVRHEANRRGLRLGADLAVCCFDASESPESAGPPGTDLVAPAADIAAHAIELLLARLADPGMRSRTIRLPPRFVHATDSTVH